MCLLGVGFILAGAACPPQPPTGCTTDADCPEGQVCNTVTGQCEEAPPACTSDDDCAEGEICNLETGECEPAPTGCTSDDQCAEGEFCDLATGECVPSENLYETVEFDHDFHSGAYSCGDCHHDGAGFDTCDTCHDRDEVVGGIAVLKDVMHDPDGGCRQCHTDETADGLWDCTKCHTALSD